MQQYKVWMNGGQIKETVDYMAVAQSMVDPYGKKISIPSPDGATIFYYDSDEEMHDDPDGAYADSITVIE